LTYEISVRFECRAATIFYRLHPTLNYSTARNNWILEVIPESNNTQGAEKLLYNQQIPDTIDREDLEKLLVFDTQSSSFEVFPEDRGGDQSYSADGALGQQFDINTNMTFVRLVSGKDSATFLRAPYISWDHFSERLAQPSNFKLLEFVLIGRNKPDPQRRETVYLMLVNTDERGISTKVSLCTMDELGWRKSRPKGRRVYLM